MDIGFIGLGLMGRPMAQHLAAAGHRLHLWARRADTLAPFKDTDAVCHDSPAALAGQVDALITIVADGPDVAELLLGPGGIADGARPGLMVADMSTISPSIARDVAEKLTAKGIDFLDAPVSGGEKGAKEATLTIMVGGKAEVFEKMRPLFEVMGRTITHIGASGAGQVAKACNQILVGAGITAVSEAFLLAKKSGVDPAKVREALLGGFAYSKVLDVHGARILAGDFKPGFKAWMHQKDLRIVMEEACRQGAPLPTAALVAQLLNALVGSGGGEEDSLAIYKMLEKLGA
ncbi:2-hydroxy-3-oxopropionate reductase [Denitratisoma sp. agr-D3]